MSLVGLIPLFPLAVGAVLLLTGRRWKGPSAGWLASAGVLASFVVSLVVTLDLLSKPAQDRLVVKVLYRWIPAGSFHVDVAFRADPLSTLMALVVTGVGALILMYSIGYMAGDPRFARYFAYKSLFVSFMLILVLANNYLLLYVGWEGVGLCSYLLIGFWFEKKSAADAAKKAFIVTRVGDAAFLIGIILIWARVGSLDFAVVFQAAPALAHGTVTVIALLLLAGACGKSAQLPLHTWLPDAMEGPTPTSALIHAATMVTAGVYLIVRSHVLFETSGNASDAVALVGLITAVYAGFSAMGQDDIKRMLAYSTMSQIGFMFFAAGLESYSAAMFLLVAHAFFKALLFLSAGSVKEALHGEQDMMKMGGLRRAMPYTTVTWAMGWLAISGIPPFSGFFAKDEVVNSAGMDARWALWIVGLFAAGQTVIYMTRGTFMTFFGEPRYEGEPHDPSFVMRAPMAVLAFAAVFGGVLNLTDANGFITRWLTPVVQNVVGTGGPSDVFLELTAITVAFGALGLTYFVYGSGRVDWMALRLRFGGSKRTLASGFYVDGVYGTAFAGGGKLGAAFLAYVVDRRIIDGMWNGLATAIGALSSVGRKVQDGLVRVYALAVLVGVVAVLFYLVVRAG